MVKSALLQLDLMEHADKPAGHYSGGNRRRLSTAIALLAAPQLLLLVSGEGGRGREREIKRVVEWKGDEGRGRGRGRGKEGEG